MDKQWNLSFAQKGNKKWIFKIKIRLFPGENGGLCLYNLAVVHCQMYSKQIVVFQSPFITVHYQ